MVVLGLILIISACWQFSCILLYAIGVLSKDVMDSCLEFYNKFNIVGKILFFHSVILLHWLIETIVKLFAFLFLKK